MFILEPIVTAHAVLPLTFAFLSSHLEGRFASALPALGIQDIGEVQLSCDILHY